MSTFSSHSILPIMVRFPLSLSALGIAAAAILLASASDATAQAVLTGRVIAASDRRPISDVEIGIAVLKRTTTTDSTGAFTLVDITPGRYLITARKLGDRPFSTMASIVSAAGVDYEYVLEAAPAELAKVKVEATPIEARFAGFEERRAKKIGRYLTAEDFAKADGRQVGDIVAAIPGVSIVRGRANEAWYASRRGAETLILSRKIRDEEINRGADPGHAACSATVVLNGQVVFSGDQRQPLFHLNTINPRDIRGVEVYTGTAAAPQEWLTGHGGCGVIAIWTK